ncbi:hypothetical protein [Bordetella sp. LUAb4]|uniref:hypothetical protein n=1 Tax=Bordetella sp. LUAb4 TaxID=2843195 RepID=UPI001E4661E8|nr:hypothetical protein [Bordetella sp. LUAb4]
MTTVAAAQTAQTPHPVPTPQAAPTGRMEQTGEIAQPGQPVQATQPVQPARPNTATVTPPESTPSTPASSPSDWHVTVSPYLWAASLRGHADIAGRRADFHMPFSTIFEDLDFSFMGNIEASNGRYGFYIDNVYTSLGQRQHVDGLSTHTRLRANWLTGGAFVRAYEQQLGGSTLAGTPRIFAIEPTMGLRWTSLRGSIDTPLGDVSSRVNWTDPFIGVRVETDLTDRWNLSAEADIGGFGMGSEFSANGQVYLGYRLKLFGHDTMLRLGYRALYQDYREHTDYGRAKWSNTMQGPVAGISIRF